MITAGEESELLVGVKNDGNSIKFDTQCCILACNLMPNILNSCVCHWSVVKPFTCAL